MSLLSSTTIYLLKLTVTEEKSTGMNATGTKLRKRCKLCFGNKTRKSTIVKNVNAPNLALIEVALGMKLENLPL